MWLYTQISLPGSDFTCSTIYPWTYCWFLQMCCTTQYTLSVKQMQKILRETLEQQASGASWKRNSSKNFQHESRISVSCQIQTSHHSKGFHTTGNFQILTFSTLFVHTEYVVLLMTWWPSHQREDMWKHSWNKSTWIWSTVGTTYWHHRHATDQRLGEPADKVWLSSFQRLKLGQPSKLIGSRSNTNQLTHLIKQTSLLIYHKASSQITGSEQTNSLIHQRKKKKKKSTNLFKDTSDRWSHQRQTNQLPDLSNQFTKLINMHVLEALICIC